jgi:hypothetical protein
MRKELANYSPEGPQSKKCLVSFKINEPGVPAEAIWDHDGRAPEQRTVRWLDFWPALLRCGEQGWPQLIRLPARFFDDRNNRKHDYRLDQIFGMLLEAAGENTVEQVASEPLVSLEPNPDGNYTVIHGYTGSPARPGGGRGSRADEHRLIVFLDATELRQTKV